MKKDLKYYIDRFQHLRQAPTKYGPAPHKAVLLLSWNHQDDIVQLEIQGEEILALFDLWEYAADEYPNCRAGDTIGKWTCREVIERDGGYGKTYLVLFTHPLEKE
jgi:hypothetical protein